MARINIAVTGPESTGKSTLSTFLASYFKAALTEEFARSYLDKHGPGYTFDDLDVIAQGQFAAQRETSASNLAIFDTELTVIRVWSKFKFQKVSPRVESLCSNQMVNLYLLPFYDVPWDYDPFRESPLDRRELFDCYIEELESRQVPYEIIRGNQFDRNYAAINAVRTALGK